MRVADDNPKFSRKFTAEFYDENYSITFSKDIEQALNFLNSYKLINKAFKENFLNSNKVQSKNKIGSKWKNFLNKNKAEFKSINSEKDYFEKRQTYNN